MRGMQRSVVCLDGDFFITNSLYPDVGSPGMRNAMDASALLNAAKKKNIRKRDENMDAEKDTLTCELIERAAIVCLTPRLNALDTAVVVLRRDRQQNSVTALVHQLLLVVSSSTSSSESTAG